LRIVDDLDGRSVGLIMLSMGARHPLMVSSFFDQPILNTPYQTPDWHHARNDDGKPLDLQPDAGGRRGSKIIIPALDRPRNSASQPKPALCFRMQGRTLQNVNSPTARAFFSSRCRLASNLNSPSSLISGIRRTGAVPTGTAATGFSSKVTNHITGHAASTIVVKEHFP
jgi:hypothetical protein